MSFPAAAADSCSSLVPVALAAQILRAFPSFRMPLESDNLAEDAIYNRDHGGSGCLGVGKGDFDGDGKADYVLGLTQVGGTGAMIVVALSRTSQWELHKLDTWPEGRGRLFVDSEPAGTFERFGGLDGPLEKGEVERMRCTHNAVVFGATESSGVAYCFSNGRWRHTWISD
jgi:hypothetical protein